MLCIEYTESQYIPPPPPHLNPAPTNYFHLIDTPGAIRRPSWYSFFLYADRIWIRKKSFRIRNEFEVKLLWKTAGNTKVKFMLRMIEKIQDPKPTEK